MIDLLSPAFLWLGALAAPLILLYLLKARRRRHTVSAVWLWEEAQKDLEARVPLRRLRRDWLLWLQLLILALLVLAAAGPYRGVLLGSAGDVAVVVDASASMLAGERPAELERTLSRLVGGLGAQDRMALIRAGSRTEVLAPLTSDRSALAAALEHATPAAAPADLTPAVELAESLVGDAGSVVVVTDTASAAAGGDGLRVIRLGTEGAANAGIVALGVRSSDSSGQDHQVFVRLANASPSPVRGTLLLRAGGRVRDAAELELAAASEAGHTLRLVGVEAAGETVIEVVWRGPDEDALAADDRAFWVLRPPAQRRYRLRGAADPYLRRALEAVASSQSPWRAARTGEDADLEILVGRMPDGEGSPLLWIDPPEGRLEQHDGAAVLSWDRTHPALRFVDLRSVRLGKIYGRARPPGARVLAESTAGPLILEGTHGARRFLMWAFDPLDTDLPLRVAYPLMVRHALEHLAPAGRGWSGRPAGSQPPVPWTGEPATLVAPSGREIPVAASGGLLQLPPLEEVGIWKLRGHDEIRFAVSLLSAAESDLTGETRDAEALPPAPERPADTVPRDALRGLWRPLVLLALALLLLEATAFHRRWTL